MPSDRLGGMFTRLFRSQILLDLHEVPKGLGFALGLSIRIRQGSGMGQRETEGRNSILALLKV